MLNWLKVIWTGKALVNTIIAQSLIFIHCVQQNCDVKDFLRPEDLPVYHLSLHGLVLVKNGTLFHLSNSPVVWNHVSHQNWHESVNHNGGYHHAKFERTLRVSAKKKTIKSLPPTNTHHCMHLLHLLYLSIYLNFNRITRRITKRTCCGCPLKCDNKQNSTERGLQWQTSQRQ